MLPRRPGRLPYRFCIVPVGLPPFQKDKEKHPNLHGPLKKNTTSMGWPPNRSRPIAGKLFIHMTNFVASNHGWYTGGAMVPLEFLDVAVSRDQVGLLNPTLRDVQLGAILNQCTGRKAKKVIAKRRVDFVSGNVNSYARILNGSAQLEKIKTCNQLSASIAQLQRERDE